MPVINGGMRRKVQAGPAQVFWYVRALDEHTKQAFLDIIPIENFVGKKICHDGEHELFVCTDRLLARLKEVREMRKYNFMVYSQENRPPLGIGAITPVVDIAILTAQQHGQSTAV